MRAFTITQLSREFSLLSEKIDEYSGIRRSRFPTRPGEDASWLADASEVRKRAGIPVSSETRANWFPENRRSTTVRRAKTGLPIIRSHYRSTASSIALRPIVSDVSFLEEFAHVASVSSYLDLDQTRRLYCTRR